MKLCEPQTELHRLNLFLRHHTCPGYDLEVAEKIRHLPGVLRVEANADRHEIDIWFKHPTAGLFGEINETLKSFGCQIATGEVR
jgi:hypothetical protein